MLKNRRHELFLREYLNNGWNGKEAYITVYGPVKTAQCQASKLFMKPKVRKRFDQMVAKIIKRGDITEEKILSQYQEAYDMAKALDKTADMVSATTAQAKLVGMLKDRVEHGQPGEFEHMDQVSDVIDELSRQVGPDIALQIGKALGVMVAIEAPAEDDSALAEAPAASDAVN